MTVFMDPVVASLARRRDELVATMDGIRSVLLTYVSNAKPVEERSAMSLLEHYSMLDAPNCGCATCMDWELRRAEFLEATRFIPKGHKYTTCACHDCRFVGRLQLNYLAAQNRRDLLIEMSFHARYHSRHGEAVMTWLDKELAAARYTTNWWAQKAARYSVERWIMRCESAVSGAVSGAVFVASAGAVTVDAPGIGSSLGGMAVMDLAVA